MTIQQVNDPKLPIGDILQIAGSEGILLESPGKGRYAVLPLDEDLSDYLLERSPKLSEACNQIRQQMKAGKFRSHKEVKEILG